MNKLRGFLSLFLLIFLTSDAFAAQSLIRAIDTENGSSDGSYLSTPKKVYTANGWVYKFIPDGKSYYPDEIYLPNETDPSSYRIHTNYTSNTDACASCHSLHTSTGQSLLQWFSNYETCMACHDGTVSTTYNVAMGLLPSGQHTSAGAFGVGSETFSSYHGVTGGALISAAPGNDLSIGNKNNQVLGCESCHSPHGLGGNARLLNPDPNGVQSVKADQYKNFLLTEITDSAIQYKTFVAYPKDTNGNPDTTAEPYYMLDGYPYEVVLRINGQEYDEDVYAIDNSEAFTKVKIYDSFLPSQITSVEADFIPSLKIRMNITNFLGVNGSEVVRYREGTIRFCAACHDYYRDEQSVAMEVYRHPVKVKINDTNVRNTIDYQSPVWINQLQYKFETDLGLTCLTCHFAHGTSSEFWQADLNFSAEEAKETDGSSALKRAPNSDLCATCHGLDYREGYSADTPQPHNEPDYALNGSKFVQTLGVASFIGSNATGCYSSEASNSCHAPIVDTWKNTLHAKSMSTATGINPYAIDNFDENNNVLSNEFFTKTGLTVDQVIYVIGSTRSQRYIYDDNGNLKVAGSEFVISNNTWVSKDIQTFTTECAGCHVTGLDPDNFSWKDNGVACEACHGSAGNHYIVPSSRNITNPRYLDIKDQIDICAQCHSFGYNDPDVNPGYSLYPYPVGYMPYAEGLKNSVTAASYELSHFFKPYLPGGDYSGNFFDTININSNTYDSVFPGQEFNDFIQSKHYQSGAVSCLTCHSSHKPNQNAQMLKYTLEQTCAECHGTSFNLDVVMPKRVPLNNNPDDNIRVHTFARQHSNDATNTGAHKEVH